MCAHGVGKIHGIMHHMSAELQYFYILFTIKESRSKRREGLERGVMSYKKNKGVSKVFRLLKGFPVVGERSRNA